VLRLFFRLAKNFSSTIQQRILISLILMVTVALSEWFAIGSILPFLSVISSPDSILTIPGSYQVIDFLGLNSPQELLLPLTILFVSAGFLTGGLRLFALWYSSRLTFSIGGDLSLNLYRRSLYQTYAEHAAQRSSDVIATVGVRATCVTNMVSMMLMFVSSILTGLAIVVLLLWVDTLMATTLFAGLFAVYFLTFLVSRHRLQINGHLINYHSSRVIQAIQEGLGSIRDVLLYGHQEAFCRLYQLSDKPLRGAQAMNGFIAGSTRYVVEALSVGLIAALAYFVAQRDGGISLAIPVLGAMALGVQRLLPAFQQAYSSWAAMVGGRASLEEIVDLLQKSTSIGEQMSYSTIRFDREIELRGVSFRYAPDSKWIFRDLCLTIKRGDRVGIVGVSGSGKSTLSDILIGLQVPVSGEIRVDNVLIEDSNRRAWQSHLAHVSQNIYISDSSVLENIAFGVPIEEIDVNRARKAAEQAQIAQTIDAWTEGYSTRIGELGARLSGGQRQRIGIARALYRKADVMVFDEATSALDQETERAVIESIKNLDSNITVIIISHHLGALRACSKVIEIDVHGNCTVSKKYSLLDRGTTPLQPANFESN
jgi:ABC-type bacteriocin/lantibiotic exporter with double-glycine peptidase domain